ncbi:sensor histidine kinase [Microbacterium aurantiacum]|uniref:sensor histidine kinase n=1 Tax=Microbacterium aurantiacum TaxID=162393 RepID=UPI000C7FCBDC|nr:histidine kinase [Microbacterium aurantiacum]
MDDDTTVRLRAWCRRHGDGLTAAGIALFCVVAAALGFDGVWDVFSVMPDEVSSWWTLATALPGTLLILAKRRAPMLALLAASALFLVDVVTVGGLGPLVVLLDVLWTAVFLATRRTRNRMLVVLAIAVALTFAAALLFTEATPAIAFLLAVQMGALLGTDYWWAVAVSQANELTELHRQRAEDAVLAAERDRAEAVRREREQMARELHDAVAGHVMAMAIRSEAALSTPPDGAADRSALRAVRDAGLAAHAELRSMIAVLRQGGEEPRPMLRLDDLEGIVDTSRRAGLSVRLVREGDGAVGATAEQAIVRVVREALANCVRHASGAEVDVTVVANIGEAVHVQVASRGGSPVSQRDYSGNGWGLSLLTERVRALGGTFIAGPTDEGWSVRAELPAAVRA